MHACVGIDRDIVVSVTVRATTTITTFTLKRNRVSCCLLCRCQAGSRLRSFLQHERLWHWRRLCITAVVWSPTRTETASAAGMRPEALEEVSAPQGAVTVGYVATPGPLLSTPLLPDAAAETLDTRTVKSSSRRL